MNNERVSETWLINEVEIDLGLESLNELDENLKHRILFVSILFQWSFAILDPDIWPALQRSRLEQILASIKKRWLPLLPHQPETRVEEWVHEFLLHWQRLAYVLETDIYSRGRYHYQIHIADLALNEGVGMRMMRGYGCLYLPRKNTPVFNRVMRHNPASFPEEPDKSFQKFSLTELDMLYPPQIYAGTERWPKGTYYLQDLNLFLWIDDYSAKSQKALDEKGLQQRKNNLYDALNPVWFKKRRHSYTYYFEVLSPSWKLLHLNGELPLRERVMLDMLAWTISFDKKSKTMLVDKRFEKDIITMLEFIGWRQNERS